MEKLEGCPGSRMMDFKSTNENMAEPTIGKIKFPAYPMAHPDASKSTTIPKRGGLMVTLKESDYQHT